MEDLKNADVAAWMKAQADYTRAMLDKIPQRAYCSAKSPNTATPRLLA